MNALVVGANKQPLFDFITPGKEPFLLIDDGPLIDVLDIPPQQKPVRFDVKRHRLNPLYGMDYRRAREFVSVMGAIFPEGADTLTKKNADFVLLNALLDPPLYLDKLLAPDKKDVARQDAYQKIASRHRSFGIAPTAYATP